MKEEEELIAEEDTPDEEISELPEYSQKSDFNKPELVEKAVLKVLESRAVEMKEGYFNTTITKTGEPIKTWVPDTRKIFISSVDALTCLLSPEINRDKFLKLLIKEFQKNKKEIFKKYSYTKLVPYNNGLKKIGEPYIPNVDESVWVYSKRENGKYNPPATILIQESGALNYLTEGYWKEMFEIYDEFFSRLNELIDRLNYFKTGVQF